MELFLRSDTNLVTFSLCPPYFIEDELSIATSKFGFTVLICTFLTEGLIIKMNIKRNAKKRKKESQ